MVINRRDIKRKRKDNNSTCNLLEDHPKRTKVHAQRKFAQGSNVSSPVITPVKEIEKQEKLKPDILPEPQELLPMNRPHTEDFLTFLCFRGTSMLPPNLNFFNAAPLDCRIQSQPLKDEPVEACPPLAKISAKTTAGGSERPFIAFGVRKRADPILVSKHMDKKRRHALALQALRRKYQEQKMAKIRAVTISKLSEKITSSKSLVRTRSVTKNENNPKKSLPQKTRVKIVTTKHVKITRAALKTTPLRTTMKPPHKTQKRMCLRSFRGRFIHHELQVKNATKKTHQQSTSKVVKKVQQLKMESRKKKETSSEFSSDDDEPLMKTVKIIKPNIKVPLPKVAKKCPVGAKKPTEINFRLTRASYPLYISSSSRDQTMVKRKIQIAARSSFPTKSPFVKLIPPRLVLAEENSKAKDNDKLRPSKSQKKTDNNEEKGVQKPGNVEKSKKGTDKIKNNPNTPEVEVEGEKKTIKSEFKKQTVVEASLKKKPDKSDRKDIKIDSADKTEPSCDKQHNVCPKKKPESAPSKKKPERNAEENAKSDSKIAKSKKAKSSSPEEPKSTTHQQQRPTRKTKEAAAIYMEILGHKLVSEGDLDDDSISIDSFPELPNVRRTEQRENELKAKAKCKTTTERDKKTNRSSPCEQIKASNVRNTRFQTANAERSFKGASPSKDKSPRDPLSDSDTSMKGKFKTEPSKRNLRNTKREDDRRAVPKSYMSFSSESGESVKQARPKNKPDKRPKLTIKTRSRKIEHTDDSDESTTSKTSRNAPKLSSKTRKMNTNKNKTEPQKFDNISFSDSDEEPLSKFTTQTKLKDDDFGAVNHKKKEQEVKEPSPGVTNIILAPQMDREDSKMQTKKNLNLKNEQTSKNETISGEAALNLSTKPKRECTKKPQNYLTLFSSSEDEDKYFHGFVVKYENAIKQQNTTKTGTKSLEVTPSADLLCKDVDKRFGKGKVNMSTEQIEKWLKESAIAGGGGGNDTANPIKKEPEDVPVETVSLQLPPALTKFEIVKIPPPPPSPQTANSLMVVQVENVPVKARDTTENQKQPHTVSVGSKPAERKTIFRKERKVTRPVPNANAFSPNNESSVYAFEADNEDSVSTPFRRPIRRPSSTATSRSEDSSKYEEPSLLSKVPGKFRLPQAIKQDKTIAANKQEVSLMLSTDETNTTSIAVRLDLDAGDVFTPEIASSTCENQLSEDGEQLFYIPLQPGKQSVSAQIIQGVAVKLGTKGANGPNQRVVMSAKLVTHTPAGAQKPLVTSAPMYPPPATAVQKAKNTDTPKFAGKIAGITPKNSDRTSENSEDLKYKVPSSPSASSSSSTKNNTTTKRSNIKSRLRPSEFCSPVTSRDFPGLPSGPAALLDAPVFHPNEKEFQDPLEYIEKIRGRAEKFGICKIVPPANFKPECKVSDDMRFTAYNQYVHKMLHRWGPNFKELMAITRYLKTQNIAFAHPPWIGGMEIDLPRLYQIVQSLGGLKEVIEKKKWPKVSELMKIPKSAQDRVTKLDDIYCKYLLPYDTLSPAEREKLFDEVETDWAKRESRALLRSQQNILDRDDGLNNSESDSDDESEECIVKGRSMALNAFYRIARNTMSMWFKTMEPTAQEVEQEFWKHVTIKQNHICVHSGSIDSGNWGYGFAVSKNSPFARHAWNLKVFTNNSGSVLRSMGPVMGVTVPTLHVGMVFSACCWYRDPHSLPWIEYLHTGGNKIWYGIPDSMSSVFHKCLVKLVPNYCRNKSLWLPSDTAMIPPSLLVENGVSLCRTIQEPGQFIVVFPKVFTSSICTGYVVSESVYFAPLTWLSAARTVFDELQKSCEPSMFSLERLLISIASDARSNVDILKRAVVDVEILRRKETIDWNKLEEVGLSNKERLPLPEATVKKKKKFQNDGGDYECEVCCRNLFVSWVSESQEDGIYCLNHAVEYIEKKKIEANNCKLVYTYDDKDFSNLLEKIKSTIEMKMQKKLTGGKNIV